MRTTVLALFLLGCPGDPGDTGETGDPGPECTFEEVWTGDVGIELSAIWGSGPSDVWAVGQDGDLRGLLVHYNGSTWETVEPPSEERIQLSFVRGTSSDEVWATGVNSEQDGKMALWTLSGGAWEAETWDVTGWLHATGRGTDRWAVGVTSEDGRGEVFRNDGAGWVDMDIGSSSIPDPVYAVIADSSEGPLFFGGNNDSHGTLWTWDGDRFDNEFVQGPTRFSSAWQDGGTIYLSGHGGYVHTRSGGAFSEIHSGSQDLSSVWASGSEVWAVGVSGTVVRDAGDGFEGFDPGTDLDLVGVWGAAPGDVWIAATHPSLLGSAILRGTCD